ncbi:MAG: diacylglycerol kinase family lipid kinase [Bacteroidota bacterium]|nr:diacylglycerol kinase family lipid kinase [Bacteroidota bacterium]MDP4234517.1 diacylglycerol kinase family lipid kinase [Bacteroidota bacterium]MDP4242582.1 diacylglycerol kinase family lipid kinase [Bacteroidota bacterium]MDP4289386.1 diacylglycerol kinase family lipid kinase [Bacteroidota bacterium]
MSRPLLFFIHNPHSNQGERTDDVRGLERVLGGRYPWRQTTVAGEASVIAREAALEGAEAIIAVGGDGTVHEIVNALMSLPPSARPKLGILPVGGGNDFAFAAGIPTDLQQALDVILRGETIASDIGSIDMGEGVGFWTNTLGLGFDAKVVVQSRRFRSLRGRALYLVSTLLTLIRDHEAFEIELSVDHHRFRERTLMLTLGNGPREGGGFYTTPNSRIDDGQLEMLLAKPVSRLMMLSLLPRVLRGTHLSSSAFFTRSFHRLSLSSDRPLVIHADGEILAIPADGIRRITVEIQPEAIRVIR